MTETTEKTGWFSRLKQGLSKSSTKLSENIGALLTKRKLDEETLEELQEVLIMGDLGVKTAADITSLLATQRFGKEVTDEELKTLLAGYMQDILTPVAKAIDLAANRKPEVVLICGVNGNGKTTTIGKLAHYYKSQGKKVMLAACDTFRAAAVSQLAIWAERAGCPLIQGEEMADPASVAYQALEQAKQEGADLLLIDTAGRLHNKANLMEELAKIIRVLKKVDEHAPHHIVLVLDATTGQNAFQQVETFRQIVQLSGLVVTKLDGTAKGGVVVGLAKQFGLPIHAIGVGEGMTDLQPFDADAFAKALVGMAV